MLIAALPPAEPPARTVAGVQITWPLTAPETELAPGSKLKVRVSSSRRRAQVSLARVNANGRALRVVGRKTLRRGTFTVTVPSAAAGARYALRVTVAGRKRWSWITTPAPVPPAAPTAPVATPEPVRTGPVCPPQPTFQAEVRLPAASFRAGETVNYTVVNVGDGILQVTESIHVVPEAERPESMSAIPNPTRVEPGASVGRSVVIPLDTTPGRYRIFNDVGIWHCDYGFPGTYKSEPFEVLAP